MGNMNNYKKCSPSTSIIALAGVSECNGVTSCTLPKLLQQGLLLQSTDAPVKASIKHDDSMLMAKKNNNKKKSNYCSLFANNVGLVDMKLIAEGWFCGSDTPITCWVCALGGAAPCCSWAGLCSSAGCWCWWLCSSCTPMHSSVHVARRCG